MQLTGSTSLQAIQERLGAGDAETLRESEKRRRYLQTYARLLTTDRPIINFSPELHTATTEYDGKQPKITLTTRAFDQPVTDLRRRVFDLAIQEALVVHEIGHLRYTDLDGFHESLAATETDRPRLFTRVWNILEDGAIERQLRHRYAVETELDILNANLLHTDALSHETPDSGRQRFSFFHAVICGLADMAIYDSGRFQQLRASEIKTLQMASLRDKRTLDRFVPAMGKAVQRILTETNPTTRNKHIWSFWTELCNTLDDATVSGAEASELARLLDSDGTVRTSNHQSARVAQRVTDEIALEDDKLGAPIPGKPDDTAGEFGPATQSARDLGRAAIADEVTQQVISAIGPDSSNTDIKHSDDSNIETEGSEEADTATSSTLHDESSGCIAEAGHDDSQRAGTAAESHESLNPSNEHRESNTQPYPGAADLPCQSQRDAEEDTNVDPIESIASTDSVSEVSDDSNQVTSVIRDRYAEELAAEVTELDKAEARIAEFNDYVQALAASDNEMSLRVVTATELGNAAASDRWQTVQRDATRLARRFQSRLQEHQRDVERSHRRRGALDRSRLVAASRGQPDVFTQIEKGENKQYTCVIMLDRSGSMGNGAVTAAETGALTTAAALESIGISVTILDLYESETRLVKTGVEEVSELYGRVLTEQTGGGTPLASALSLVRTRFREAENPFVIVVTDGRPDDVGAYKTELESVTFPVLGVYLRSSETPETRSAETDRSCFHRLAVVEEWSRLTQRLERLAERILF